MKISKTANLKSLALFILVFICVQVTQQSKPVSKSLNDLKLQKCNLNAPYPLTVSDIQIHLTNNWKAEVNGTLKSEINLDEAIQAHVDLKRYELFWIPVPCMSSNIGSCTYPDLCAFGVPSNRTCPKVFVEQNVPCRCPIRKGSYSIHMITEMPLTGIESVYSGEYKGSVFIKKKGTLLSCYDFSFTLVDNVWEKQPSVLLIP